MENNKLSQLTQQLYEQGLEKGRAEGERIVAQAEEHAGKIVAQAEERAAAIARKADSDARELHKNTMTELTLAGHQAIARVKDAIASAIVARSVSDGVQKAGLDPAFIKEMLLEIARNWNGGTGKATLEALLPAERRKELDTALAGSVQALLKEGIEVGYSDRVRSGFRVGEKNGGYYIGFEDENFRELLGHYLREKVTALLYDAK